MLKNNLTLIIFCLLAQISVAQLNTYNYAREITGITQTWHSIDLPDAVFGKVSNTLTDFRIYGITKSDTIEVPYLLKITSEKQTDKTIDFTLLNSSNKGNEYFFTFEISSEESINEIKLNFKEQNFNWQVAVEGSQDNKEWFSIVEDYRILSIKNEQTDYQFTKVRFPNSKYKYLRLSIKADKKPELITAETQLNSFQQPIFNTFSIKDFKVTENKTEKKTIVDIDLSEVSPVSLISLKIKDAVDYYRPVSIQYLADSVKTEKGYIYNFNTLDETVLSSLENNDLFTYSTITKKLRLEIENYDNRPLQIDGVTVKGYKHQLIARFTEEAKYYLVYGNANANSPNYDISKFTDNIPTTISEVKLSAETKIDKKEAAKKSPLFENKAWLWAIMGLIIVLLGWFTLKMMKKK